MAAVYTMKRAAQLTGLKPATLRAWEHRYGVAPTGRTPSGYRLYDDRAVGRLRAMKAMVAAGASPREAAARLDTDGERGRSPRPEAGPRDAAADDLVAAAASLDTRAMARALDRAFERDPFEQVVDEWLMPLLQDVGDRWSRGDLGVAAEHALSATVQRRLGAHLDAAGPLATGATRVLVGLPRDCRHEIGALAAATALRRSGLDAVYLGADLPVAAWIDGISRLGPAAAVVGVPTGDDVVAAQDTCDVLGAAGLTAYVGGAAAAAVRGDVVVLEGGPCAAAQDLATRLSAGAR